MVIPKLKKTGPINSPMKSMGTPFVFWDLVLVTRVHLWALMHSYWTECPSDSKKPSCCQIWAVPQWLCFGISENAEYYFFLLISHFWHMVEWEKMLYYNYTIDPMLHNNLLLLALYRSNKCDIFMNRWNIKILQHRMYRTIYFKYILHSYLSLKVTMEATKWGGHLF